MKIFGQDVISIKNQALALIFNVISWILSIFPRGPKSLPKTSNVCVSISGPGGLDQLRFIDLPNDVAATVGYNVKNFKSPFVSSSLLSANFPEHCVLVRTSYFSINYADVTIRWGLYESALRYVGWPIVPGFDFSGVVIKAGSSTQFKEGDEVFGFSLFGAYSSNILVPEIQIRKLSNNLTLSTAAALPAVAGTALHALTIAGLWPVNMGYNNQAVLIHSAAGGVGSMLIQMCKILNVGPIVAIVGSKHKVQFCKDLGADYVIDKSQRNIEMWKEIEKISPDGYKAIFDANGISTLSDSYEHLSRCGVLVVYGFHSNLPKATELLSPLTWCKMIFGLTQMPRFDTMDMVLQSKAVVGFNLSFFADETVLIDRYMNQIVDWVDKGLLTVAQVTTFSMENVSKAHELIQSGVSVGKIVVQCPTKNN